MTVNANDRRAGPYTGGTLFPFDFKVFEASDIRVILTSEIGVDSTLVLDTDYTVTLNPDQVVEPGGEVAYADLGIDEQLTILGNLEFDQGLALPNGGNFNAANVETALDKLTMLVQQVYEKIGRAVLQPVTSILTNILIPAPEEGKFLRWIGGALSNADVAAVGVGLPLAISEGGTGVTTKAAAQAALEIAATTGFVMSGKAVLKAGADIVSAATVNLNAATGNVINVIGNNVIQSFGAPQDGAVFVVSFAGTPIIEHNAAVSQPIILLAGANAAQTAGSTKIFAKRAGAWYEVAGGPLLSTASTLPVATKAGAYALVAGDKGTEVNFSTAGVTCTMLAAAIAGNGFLITIRNSAASGDVTLSGNVDGITSRKLRPGDCVTLRSDGSTWRTVRGAYSFESAEQAVSLATLYTIAHGLGVAPNHVRLVFRCKIPEGGWSVGDELQIGQYDLGNSYGSAWNVNATNIELITQQTYTTPWLRQKSNPSATAGYPTPANWRYVVYAKDMRG